MIDYKKQAETKARIKRERFFRKWKGALEEMINNSGIEEASRLAFQDALIFGVGKVHVTVDGAKHVPYGSSDEDET